MQEIKNQILSLVQSYNAGRPVAYPIIDRKIMQQQPEVVKQGLLPSILDELVKENLLMLVGPSSYVATAHN